MASETDRIGVVLIHGFISSEAVWEDFRGIIAGDPELEFVDVLPFHYDSPKLRLHPLRRIPDLNDIADSLDGFLDVDAGGYKQLVLVAHSQGGLVVQRYLSRALGRGRGLELARIKRIILFACPNDGSALLLSLRRRFHWNPQLRGLEPLSGDVKDTQRVVMDQVVHADELSSNSCPIPIAAYAGESDDIVLRSSAQSVFPEAGVLPGDHFSIVKPDSIAHRSYTALKDRLLAVRRAAEVTEPQLTDAANEIRGAVQEAVAELDPDDAADEGRTSALEATLQVAQLLHGLGLGAHDEAERRVYQFFLPLTRDQQRAAVEAMIRVAVTSGEGDQHTTQLVACALVEAAGRLDPSMITVEDIELLARSSGFSLRSSAAVLLWQWAESTPGWVPIPLLGRLTQPSKEDWYVHAAARAGAKQLLLRRAAARAIFDTMAASNNKDDRDYAISDLVEVAQTEPRAVPVDLVRKLAEDPARSVASRAKKLLHTVEALSDGDRREYYGPFGM